MATYQILTWHGIPAGVRVKDGKKKANQHLPQRFQVAIDAAAMEAGLTNSTDYMDGWQYSDPVERPGTVEEVSQSVIDELVAEYSPDRVKTLRMEVELNLKENSS